MNILNQILLKKEVFSHALNPNHACDWLPLFSRPYYDKMNYIADYLYEVWYSKSLSDQEINDYFRNYKPDTAGGCSALYYNNKLYRNLDWYYSHAAEFVIHDNSGKYKVLGLGGNVKALSNQFVKSGKNHNEYKYLNYKLTDGINEKGVSISINVVPNDKGVTIGTNPDKPDMCMLYIPKYILSNFDNAHDACVDIANNWNVYAPEMSGSTQEFHFLVNDLTSCYCLEFVENEAVITEAVPPAEGVIAGGITNFHLNGINEDFWNSIEDNGQGVERFIMMLEAIETSNLDTLLQDLRYTKLVEVPWLTEFTGLGQNLTVKNAHDHPEYFDDIVAVATEKYANRSRDNADTWQTVHSSIYDVQAKTLSLNIQEDWSKTYTFEL